jgi:hypothetical protein
MDVWIVKICQFIAKILLLVLFQSTDNYDDTKLKPLWRNESFKKIDKWWYECIITVVSSFELIEIRFLFSKFWRATNW